MLIESEKHFTSGWNGCTGQGVRERTQSAPLSPDLHVLADMETL